MGKIVHEKPDSQSRKKRFVMKHKAIAKVIAIVVVATSCGSLNNNNHNSNGVDAFSFGITTSHNTNNNNNNAIRRPTAPLAIATRHDSRKRNLYRLNNHHQHHHHYQRSDDEDLDLDDGFDDGFDEETNTTMERKQHPKNNPFANMLVAAAFLTATLDPIGAMAKDNSHDVIAAHKGLDLVSPGTTLIETKTDPKLVQNTETTLNKLAKTTFLANNKRKAELTDSVKRIKSTITTELTTVEAWKEVTKILQDYGVDLKKDTSVVVRPPADWRTTYDDFVLNKRVNVLLNGEIIQIQLEYQKGSNSKETMENLQPDDEWVLRIRGYKGYDPSAPIVPMDNSRQPQQRRQTPEWYQRWDRYWNSPTTFGLGIAKSNGDAIVLGGSTAVALSYAVSYAYYVDMNEKEDQKALEKQTQIKAKKEAAAAAKMKADTKEEDKTKKPTTPKPTRKAKKEKAVADKAAAVKAKEEEAVAAKSKKEELAAAKVAAARAKKEEAAAAKSKKEEIAASDSVAAEAKKKKAAAAKVVAAKAKKEEAAAAKDLAAKAKMEKRNDEDKKSSKEPKPSKIEANKSATTTTTTTTTTATTTTPTTTAIKPVFVGKTVAAVPSDDSTVAPVEAAPTDDQADETDDDVRVTIDFDEDGKVVIRTSMDEESSLRRKDGALAFVQALYFPWLGFFVSSSPASDADDDRPKIVRFAQALYFPWVGVFFPKEFTTTSTSTSTSTTMTNNDTALDETAKNKNNQDGNNGVLPLIRALWFPWIGIFQGK